MLSPRVAIGFAVPALILLASSLSTRSGGVQSGASGVPLNASSQLPSCSACHSGAQPQTGRTNGPTVDIVVSELSMQPNQQITVTTTINGGVAGTEGGFLCEASAGSFTPGSATRIINNPASITHNNDQNRSWTYTFTAPNTSGLVELTAAGNSVNGSGTGGDEFAFSGWDSNATSATPVRLFVLPQGLANFGFSCSDGFGNFSVLGANSSPTIGNQSFAWELHGATPGALAFLLAGFNPPNFTPIDLGPTFGLTDCDGYVASAFFTLSGFTSGGAPERAEGSVSFPFAVPNAPVLQGVTLTVQSAYVDPSAQSLYGRSLPFSLSHGLTVTFQ